MKSLPKIVESQGMRLLRQLFLRGHRIFNTSDALTAATLEKIPHNQLRKILSSLAKHGLILRLRRGLYVSIGLLPDYTKIHPFVISAFLIQPSEISHWSALQHHGLTEQLPRFITASTPFKFVTPSMRQKHDEIESSKHAWEIQGVRYEYMTIQQKHFDIGKERIWLDENFQILITDKERTLLDVFISPKMFGGMGEALGILENALADIDINKLIDYIVQYEKKSIAKRIGWALEHFGIPAKKLDRLLKIPMQYYCKLDPLGKAIGPCEKRWMIQNNLAKWINNEIIAYENRR